MAEYFDLEQSGQQTQDILNTIKYNGDGTKVLDNTGVYSLVDDNKIGNRTIQEPEANTGTATGFLTVLLNKLTAAIRALRISVSNHTSRTDNPHLITKSQAGLGEVDNIKQASKTEFDSHNNDNEIHVTPEDKTNWNGKADITYVDDKIENAEIKLDNAVGITVDNEDLKVTGAVLVAGEDGDYYFDETGKGNKLLCYSKQGAFLHDLGYGKQESDNRFANAIIGKANGKTLTLNDVQSSTDFSKVKILGETTEVGTGEKSPDNPYELQGVENPVVAVSDGVNTETYPITTSAPLYSLPDGTKDNVIIDDITKTTQLIRNVGEYVYNGSEPWACSIDANDATNPTAFFHKSGDIYPQAQTTALNSRCSHFKMAQSTTGEYTTEAYVIFPNSIERLRINKSTIGVINTDTVPIRISKFNEWIASQISSGHPFTVQVQLATPTTAQLAPLTVPTYSPTTIISADKGRLDVEYNRDINKVLDGLYAAITALGGSI